jgi:hypothetical protein
MQASILDEFRSDLIRIDAETVYNKYIAPEQCFGLAGVDQRGLREQIATHFCIDLSCVVIVGSAKLGFTLKQGNSSANRPRFSQFAESSDVDIAIVSNTVFDCIWKQCLDFWHRSGYANSDVWQSGGRFRNYFFRGWMRPDLLPSEGTYTYRNSWFDYFQKLTSGRAAGDFKIAAGLYRETHFLRTYQTILIEECRQEMSMNV